MKIPDWDFKLVKKIFFCVGLVSVAIIILMVFLLNGNYASTLLHKPYIGNIMKQFYIENHEKPSTAVSAQPGTPSKLQEALVTAEHDPQAVSEFTNLKLHRTTTAANAINETNAKDPHRLEELKQELERRLKNATEKKIILVWQIEREFREGWSPNFGNCGNCDVTYNKSMINNEKTGAVVIWYETMKKERMPPKETKNPDHLYIYKDLESPSHHSHARKRNFDFEDNYGFNATMNYRLDADFYLPYDFQSVVSNVLLKKGNLTKIMDHKEKTAVAIISNCRSTPTAAYRYKLVEKVLETDLALETFGNCFQKDKKFADGANRFTRRFLDEIRQYKFYFSFENSYHCRNYITEKVFFNAMKAPTVPVVWGSTKEDYEAVIPRNSFIFAEDFANVQELVKYLQYLDKNDTAYLEYFKWYNLEESANPLHGRTSGFCQICRALHGINYDDIYNSKYNWSNPTRPLFTDGVSRRILPSISGFLYKEERKECLNYIHNRSFLGE